MPLVHSRVDITDNFDRVTDAVNQQARRAVDVAAFEGAKAAVAKGAERGMGPAIVEPAVGTVDGWLASFVMEGPHQWWQNYGTLGSRVKPLKRPPQTDRTRAPGTGIKPLGHLDAGKREGRRALLREIARGL